MSAEAARRAALVEVGGLEQVKERVRDVRVGALLETRGRTPATWLPARRAARIDPLAALRSE